MINFILNELNNDINNFRIGDFMNEFDNENMNLDNEVDVNKKNQDTYNSILQHSQDKDNGYWDRNNPVIKIILLILFVIAFIGTIYYFITWLKVK